MLVEVIKRPYRKYKVGQQFELKPKDARLLIILKRVKEVSDGKEEAPVSEITTKTRTRATKPVAANKVDVDLSGPEMKDNKIAAPKKARSRKKKQVEEAPE